MTVHSLKRTSENRDLHLHLHLREIHSCFHGIFATKMVTVILNFHTLSKEGAEFSSHHF